MSDVMPEEWRPVPDHPDYEVSNRGRVRSWKRGGLRVMNLYTDKLGYVRVSCDGVHISVHRAIAEAWHGPCPVGKEVDHINDVSTDNRPENLQYLTRAENTAKRRNYLTDKCGKGHPLSGDNLMIRPSNGRRECRACLKDRMAKRQFTRACTAEGCDRIAKARLRTDSPICEMHYQRERAPAKRARLRT